MKPLRNMYTSALIQYKQAHYYEAARLALMLRDKLDYVTELLLLKIATVAEGRKP